MNGVTANLKKQWSCAWEAVLRLTVLQGNACGKQLVRQPLSASQQADKDSLGVQDNTGPDLHLISKQSSIPPTCG